MNIQKEIELLAEQLKRQRDEIEVRIHLAGMDLRDEWKRTEQRWRHFWRAVDAIGDESKETTDDFIASTRAIGAELAASYERFSRHIPK